MALKIVRRIRGNVHDSIDVSELEDKVLEHPFVQRLRRIHQGAFLHYVFPGATHTRFEHSLGVMHLAGVAWRKLELNQNRIIHTIDNTNDFESREQAGKDALVHGTLYPTRMAADSFFKSDYIVQALRLAALLHDVGHPPFSHSGERFLPSLEDVIAANPDTPPYLREYFEEEKARALQKGMDPSEGHVRHEIFSLLLIDKILQDTYLANPGIYPKVAPQDVLSLITGHIPPSPSSLAMPHDAFQVCRELVSGELDIDRMDYLLRDSRECGVVYGIFDSGRILDSICLYFDPNDQAFHVGLSFSGLAAFDDYLRARYSMYLQLYFHKTATAAEAMMQNLAARLANWTLPAEANAFAGVDEYNIYPLLREQARVCLQGKEEQDAFDRLARDLFFDRKLWKRVYEVICDEPDSHHLGPLERVRAKLLAEGITTEQISSAKSLTRFQPRKAHEKSRNSLKLIKKDEFQFPRVVPIEDYSSLISANASFHIHRIYVPQTEDIADIKRLVLQQTPD